MDLADEMRGFAKAYPEKMFTPFSKEETTQHANVITRASAAMGRHLAPWLTAGADAVDARRALWDALLLLYVEHGPGHMGSGMTTEPYESYAAMTKAEVDDRWDFPNRHEWHGVAKLLVATKPPPALVSGQAAASSETTPPNE